MKLPEEAELLRIFIGESDRYEGKPLYEAIVEEARRQNLGGATVFRGLLGYGAHSRMHTAKLLRLSEDLPVVIEIVDSTEKIQSIPAGPGPHDGRGAGHGGAGEGPGLSGTVKKNKSRHSPYYTEVHHCS